MSACFHVENHPPTASANVDNLSPSLGDLVTFDGSLSSDVDGDKLSYLWEVTSRPIDSQAQLSDPKAMKPTMQIDQDGPYQVKLVVSDRKLNSKADYVNLSTVNLKPKAVVKSSPPTQNDAYVAGDVIELDASGSIDPENQSLFYHWQLVSKPALSNAILSNSTSVKPSFTADVAGQYMVHLVVDDGKEVSLTANAQFAVISANDPPIAIAKDITNSIGLNYVLGDTLTLFGGDSYDPENQPLIYRWEVFETPMNSQAVLTQGNALTTSFTADQVGHYIIHLYVDDGVKQSEPASVIFEIAKPVRRSDTRPFAEAGFDQPLYLAFTVVQLDGTKSYDVENDPLIYKWDLLVIPEGSNAKLSSVNAAQPQFTADILGSYVARLVVSDVNGDSHFDTVVVTPHEDPKLACGDCHNDEITRGKKPGHLLTYDDCMACHFTTGFLPTRGTFHAHGHQAQPSQCTICHDGVTAKTKPFHHIETDKDCNACHLLSNGTWVPALRVPGKPQFSHRGIFSGCVDCHDNIIKTGKPEGHMPASTRCGACHATNVWTPATHLEHTQALGACRNCHDPDQDKKVQPVDHLKTKNNCLACHDEAQWVPVVKVDHEQVVGSCASCHDGIIAGGKPAGHIESSTFCDKCHTTSTWFQITAAHDFFTGSCISCHDGVVATGAPNLHTTSFTQLCEACHNEAVWIPDGVNHTQVLGPCSSCHDQTDSTFRTGSHMSTTDKCGSCHGTVSWVPVVEFDHFQVVGDCIDCHNNVVALWKSSTHINATNGCEACHSTQSFKVTLEVDHNMVIGACVECHDGGVVRGQSLAHMPTTNLCEACHSTTAFKPVILVDHLQTTAPCFDCHNDQVAIGKATIAHIATTEACEKCHTYNWLPVFNVDHAEVIGACVSCHNNTIAIGKPSSHSDPIAYPNVDNCENCHSRLRWLKNFPVDHEFEVATCSSSGCHDGAVAMGQTTTHISATNVCEACHFVSNFAPAKTVPHSEISGSCARCHNGSIGAGKPDTHISSSDKCEACHGIIIWISNNFDHTESTEACVNCHNGVSNSGKFIGHVASDNNCETCHTTKTWLSLTPQGHILLSPTNCVSSGCHAIGLSHGASVVEDCSSCHIVADWLNYARPTTQRAPSKVISVL